MRGTLSNDAPTGATAATTTSIYNSKGTAIPIDLQFTKTDTGWTVQAANKGVALGSPIAIPFDAAGDHTTNDVTIPAAALDGIVGTAGSWPATGITVGFGTATDPTHLQSTGGQTAIVVAEQDGNDGQTASGVVTGVHLTSTGPELVIDGQQIPYTSITDVQS